MRTAAFAPSRESAENIVLYHQFPRVENTGPRVTLTFILKDINIPSDLFPAGA
jgi:hypothetical protein